MENKAFVHWFSALQVCLVQVGHLDRLSKLEQLWFYQLYASNWIPAYHAARLFVESPIVLSA